MILGLVFFFGLLNFPGNSEFTSLHFFSIEIPFQNYSCMPYNFSLSTGFHNFAAHYMTNLLLKLFRKYYHSKQMSTLFFDGHIVSAH